MTEVHTALATHSDRPRTLIGLQAPNFQARSTQGEILLNDFTGSWILLFFHPADFTPVCTTEFIELSRRKEEFDQLNVKLVGLSIDSVFSHMAWVAWIKANFDVQINFPIVEDISMRIAEAYGLIGPQNETTAGSRVCCFISPEQRIEALIHYPMQIGRSIDEIIRVFHALQEARRHGCTCPANWQPGDETMVYPDGDVSSYSSWLAEAMKLEAQND